MIKRTKNIIILLTLYLTACTPLETNIFSDSSSVETKVITNINAIDEIEPNINFRINQGAFIDNRYFETLDYSNSHTYYSYYKDQSTILLNFTFRDNHTINNTVSQAFLYSRFVGWLPEKIRESIKEINFKQGVLVTDSTFKYDQLIVNLKYIKDFDQDNREEKYFSSFAGIFLLPFYQELSLENRELYESIVNISNFRISKKADESFQYDFFESYLFYLYYKNIDEKDEFKVFDYLVNMNSRFNFFESIGLDIKEYTFSEAEEIKQVMIKDSPLFRGTVWDLPLVFKDQEKSTFSKLGYNGISSRFTYDHQAYRNGWNYRDNYIFVAEYEPGYQIEFQISNVFEVNEATQIANLYSFEFGKLPKLTRVNLNSVSLFKAPFAAGGRPGNIVIAIDPERPIHKNPSFLELVLHEAGHASLDYPNQYHGFEEGGILVEERWLEAAKNDNYFISFYSESYPLREDIAETINVYLLYRFKSYMIDPDLIKMIERVIPNRIAYLDEFDFSFPN
jgi:hypothetical protein